MQAACRDEWVPDLPSSGSDNAKKLFVDFFVSLSQLSIV